MSSHKNRVAAASIVALLATLAGCDSASDDVPTPEETSSAPSAESDVSPTGQVAYACALVQGIEGDPSTWSTFVGQDADEGVLELSAAASLLGGSAAYTLPDYPELSEHAAEVFKSLMTADQDLMASEFAALVTSCETAPAADDADVSETGRMAYACELAGYVVDERGDVETWGKIGDEPAWHEAASVGALVGAMIGYPGDDPQTKDGVAIVGAVSQMNPTALQEGLDAFVANCGD
ncbi:hypothetical protein [Cumulibacter soli]|uniref:hypothetical protein n=1 Tax=Cumulibacter soli TaxID=2546344 RepID=UPI001068CB5C|nr:hypothetical protein [Cumulibacter soli]